MIGEKTKAGKEIGYIFLFSNPVCKLNRPYQLLFLFAW